MITSVGGERRQYACIDDVHVGVAGLVVCASDSRLVENGSRFERNHAPNSIITGA
jgi:hypothetical protein